MSTHGAQEACLAAFDAGPTLRSAASSRALLTSCPLNGLSNQLLAILASAALAHDFGGVPFWAPPLVVRNFAEARRSAPEIESARFCATCYERLANATTTPIGDVLNATLLEGAGGVRLPIGALLDPGFRRSRSVVDVCRSQQRYGFVRSDAPCEPPELVASRMVSQTPSLARQAQGAAAHACVRSAALRALANASTGPLWIRLGPTVQDYYGLCGKPPLRLPPFFALSAPVVALGADIWSELLRLRTSGWGQGEGPMAAVHGACAHIRLSLPGEGWDELGSPFTEAAPAQVASLRKWLVGRQLDRTPVLLLSDAPWLLQRLIPELGFLDGTGCVATGGCALADDLLGRLASADGGAPASQHVKSAAAQSACAAAGHLLLTPKSSFSKLIRMLALRRGAAGARRRQVDIAYTRARVRFAASERELPLLARVRECARAGCSGRGGAASGRDDEPRRRCIADAVGRLLAPLGY